MVRLKRTAALLVILLTTAGLSVSVLWSMFCMEQLTPKEQIFVMTNDVQIKEVDINKWRMKSKEHSRLVNDFSIQNSSVTWKDFVNDGPLFPPCLSNKFGKPSQDYSKHFVGPFKYIPQSKNPCWLNNAGIQSFNLSCIPYFFLAGVSKCGSTDIFARLSGHPQIVQPHSKEIRWFDIRRYAKGGHSFEWYVSNFKEAASQISDDINRTGFSRRIVGDGSPTYFWRNYFWDQYPEQEGCVEPRLLIPSFIRHLVPQAKIIISFRNPVDSLYSKYLSQSSNGTLLSPEHFHFLVETEIQRYQKCIHEYSVRRCAYNITLSKQALIRLEKGLYSIFLADWFRIFPRTQVHIIRFEDYILDLKGHLIKLFHFLDLDNMTESGLQDLISRPVSNKGQHYSIGPMLASTRRALHSFYSRFNQALADMLQDKRYLWQS